MPSPIGHALAGVAAGWLVLGAPRPAESPRWWRETSVWAGLSILADIDLFFGGHRGATHSLGAAVAVGIVAYLIVRRAAAVRPFLVAFACLLAYGSHVLLDWLGQDVSAPIGVMAFWPFSQRYYESSLHVFSSISRRHWVGWPFVRHNLIAIVWELAILVPLLTAVWFGRRRPPASGPS
jgi:hypothetical protein